MFEELIALFDLGIVATIFKYIFSLAPIWLPIVLAFTFVKIWLSYVQADFLSKQKYVLLEVRLPREIRKSPAAMELALNAMQQGGPNTFIKKFWKGEIVPWFSLEMVSIGGEVHFYIWTREFYRRMIEYNLYAQYPDVEIVESEDYTKFFEYDKEKISLWGCEFVLTAEDAKPIQTYIDYDLDKNPKEEEKVDPITPVIEYLGSIGPGEQIWIQVLIRKHEGRKKKGTFFGTSKFKDEAEAFIHKTLGRDPKTKFLNKDDSGESEGRFSFRVGPELTEEEKSLVKAVDRKVSKSHFDCGIRGIYLAEQDVFNPVSIPGLIGSWRQYSSNYRNGFKPTRGLVGFNYPWQDFQGKRQESRRKTIFDAYRKRSYFYAPYAYDSFVLSSEELATIYHFPGGVSQAPTLKRIESKKSEPPSNLPT